MSLPLPPPTTASWVTQERALSMQGSTAEVYLHGAHVVSWRNPAGKVCVAAARLPGCTAQQYACAVRPVSPPPHWRETRQLLQEILFTSEKALFCPPKAIRCAAVCLTSVAWRRRHGGGGAAQAPSRRAVPCLLQFAGVECRCASRNLASSDLWASTALHATACLRSQRRRRMR